jgi:hypothetical protein
MSDTRHADGKSLVTTNTAQFTCPYCGVFAQHDKLAVDRPMVFQLETGVSAISVVMKCFLCKKDTYFLVRNEANQKFEILHQYPLPITVGIDHLPSDIAPVVLEAEKCLAVGAPNACGVMCRRAVHVLCQDKGASGKDLFEQLQDLKNRHVITPDLWEWTEELRVAGKHGAHPEWQDVTLADADYAMRFLREVLRYVYVNPAERAARKLKETSTKK